MQKLMTFLVLSLLFVGPQGLLAQSPTTEQPKAAAASPAPSAPSPPPASTGTDSSLNAKELQGLDVFASGGQQLGKVAKVNTSPDGKVKNVEVQSGGFLGMFKTTYFVPAEKVTKKGGRIELSLTTDQAKQLTR